MYIICYHVGIMKANNWTELIDAIIFRRVSFSITFFVVFFIMYGALAWLDFLPELVNQSTKVEKIEEEKKGNVIESKIIDIEDLDKKQAASSTIVSVSDNILPDTIIFDSLDRSIKVLNPTSKIVSDLDNALLGGVVRHPDSATLGQSGAVFILGHSSYLPTVLNSNFKAFNGIQNLKWGDIVRLKSGSAEYVYHVEKVYRAKAADTTVSISSEKQRLVLATCNSFGSIDDRYIVEADLFEVKQI